MKAIVVGSGTFGLCAALELERRGWAVTLVDQGPIPHPLAASTDISKVCRMEYGPDEDYMAFMEEARLVWLEWNERWRGDGTGPLYHESGVLMVCLDPMAPGGFEHESLTLLEKRGHRPERIGGNELTRRFPAWGEQFVDGFFHPTGGFAESGRVVEALAAEARGRGIEIRADTQADEVVMRGEAVVGIRSENEALEADHVVLACGSWAANLLPKLAGSLRRTYHPVWHLKPKRPEDFTAERFPTFTADVARTGFYGFPLHPRAGVVKIGHHGLGVAPPSDGRLEVPDEKTESLRRFLSRHFPALADSEVTRTRLCPYCDTPDEDFWIARDPERSGLTVATGGSGHGFKFAPVLGVVIADAVEGKPHPLAEKFAWRPELQLDHGFEAARCHEEVL